MGTRAGARKAVGRATKREQQASAAASHVPPRAPDDLPPDVLDRPAAEGVRWLALLRLDELAVAHARLSRDDGESLHDFRVAMRRLRSALKTYRSELADSVSTKDRRRLSRLAAASGTRRDADVHLQWLAEAAGTVPEVDATGVAPLERALRRDWRAADRRLQRELARSYEPAITRLARRLTRYRVTRVLAAPESLPPLRAVAARALRDLADRFVAALDVPRSVDDREAIHKARIAAKRLRYALEPFAEAGDAWVDATTARAARVAVGHLQGVQDDLGEIHDAHVLEAWLADRAAEWAARAARRIATDADTTETSLVPATVLALQEQLRARAAVRWFALTDEKRVAARARLLGSVEQVRERLASAERRRRR